MRESLLWKLVIATILFGVVLVLVVRWDSGFLSMIPGDQVIAVSTGERIEMVVTPTTPFSGNAATNIYWLKKDGSVEKRNSFGQVPMCVTAIDGSLFVGFAEGGASIFKDGRWVRGLAHPTGLGMYDVAPLGGKIYAFGSVGDRRKLAVRVMDDSEWRTPAEPFDAGKQVFFRGCVDVEGGIEVVYGAGPVNVLDIPDVTKARWYHAFFDGNQWGIEKPLELPPEVGPCPSSYKGRLAFVLTSVNKNVPVRIALVEDDKVKIASEVPPMEKLMLGGWLVALDGQQHLVLSSAGIVWDVKLDQDLKPVSTTPITGVSAGSKVRSNIYVALFAVVAVVLISLGSAWLLVRLRRMRGGEEG